ncbi:MAG: hypothetical protein M3552_11610 [Planctomycetota bacterium]|nr:hypothetical protein [Planctomycetaceae bacterium]MDQ3331281.1 hypothetical protein [Planctomycetota bacterium]
MAAGLLVAAAGLVAGACAWLAVSGRIDFEYLPPEIMDLLGRPTPEEEAKFRAAVRARDFRTAATSFAILGLASGGLIGLAAGARRNRGSAAVGLAAGLALGGVFGAAGGATGQFLSDGLQTTGLDSILRTMAASAGGFVVAAIGVGAGAAVASRRSAPLPAAVAAALIAGLVYPLLAAALFPAAPTDKPMPWDAGPLLVWAMLPAGLMGLAVGRAGRPCG